MTSFTITSSLIKSSFIAAAFTLSAVATFGTNAAPSVFAEPATQELQAAPDEGAVISAGEWTKKSFKSSGTWTIYTRDGQTFVELSGDFKTRRAPDLKIFLSPLSADEVNGRNATDGSVLIAPLSSNKGGQTYLIPSSVDVSDYTSILIHCEKFSKLWSASDL